MERVISQRITASVGPQMDPMQFAYRAKRGTEDATLSLVHSIAQHLDTPRTYARVLFLDYSAAFNTMHTHILIQKLIDLSVNGCFIRWITDFLTHRPQKVLANGTQSKELVLSTGAPQGCVLSALLFSIYTDELRLKSDPDDDKDENKEKGKLNLHKYSDDMALVALLFRKQQETIDSVLYFKADKYFDAAEWLQQWCKDNFLQLNPLKTKELIIDPKPISKPDSKAHHRAI